MRQDDIGRDHYPVDGVQPENGIPGIIIFVQASAEIADKHEIKENHTFPGGIFSLDRFHYRHGPTSPETDKHNRFEHTHSRNPL
jgi:hypothetical protein